MRIEVQSLRVTTNCVIDGRGFFYGAITAVFDCLAFPVLVYETTE